MVASSRTHILRMFFCCVDVVDDILRSLHMLGVHSFTGYAPRTSAPPTSARARADASDALSKYK